MFRPLVMFRLLRLELSFLWREAHAPLLRSFASRFSRLIGLVFPRTNDGAFFGSLGAFYRSVRFGCRVADEQLEVLIEPTRLHATRDWMFL